MIKLAIKSRIKSGIKPRVKFRAKCLTTIIAICMQSFLLSFLPGVVPSASANDAAVDPKIKQYRKKIQDFLDHNFAYSQVGIVVQALDDNSIIYQHDAHKLFIPASLIKLFTLATSLEELTPKFIFNTEVKVPKKSLQKDKLNGDLAIVFAGDPSFNQTDLHDLVEQIKQKGITDIKGNIIIDDTLFSDLYGHGWTIDDLPWAYAAPSGSIIIAENKIPVTVNPINRIGQAVDFYISDKNQALYPLPVKSEVLAVTSKQSIEDCKLHTKVSGNNEVFFSGCAQIDQTVQNISLALRSPRMYLQKILLSYLKNNKINLSGKIVFHKAPDQFTTIAAHKSDNLFELSKVMMKNSNNIYAHSIGKAMGAKKYGEGSFKTSSKAIKNVLHNKFTINTSTLHIADSSGLSKYNAATPNHFIRLLQAIHNDSYLKKDVAKILSKPGEKGTLKNRLTASDLRHNVVAKTGTLRNSSALAGYIVTKTGKDLAFVFMVNNMIYNDGQVKQLTDELCEILVNLG